VIPVIYAFSLLFIPYEFLFTHPPIIPHFLPNLVLLIMLIIAIKISSKEKKNERDSLESVEKK